MANIDNPAAEMAAEGFFRIALGVEYKGSRYRGWQRQASGVLSVQETLEDALSKVADSPVSLMCAGRTDAGVHACGQVVHFDTRVERSMKAWTMGANINLPHDISVSWAKVMPAHFHARFKAIARRYRYVIYNDQIRPAHLNQEITWNHRPLDEQRMAEAARYPGRYPRLQRVPCRAVPGQVTDQASTSSAGDPARQDDCHRYPCWRLPASHGAQHCRGADDHRCRRAPGRMGA